MTRMTDNDLLSDAVEAELSKLLDACRADTDGDGVEDGYEYQSALDLNDDRYQGEPSLVQPYPVKRPYPNPLFKDAQFDYDGDSLTLAEEQALWKYTYEVNHSATRTLEPLSYTDGMQHSVHRSRSGPQRAGAAGRGVRAARGVRRLGDSPRATTVSMLPSIASTSISSLYGRARPHP